MSEVDVSRSSRAAAKDKRDASDGSAHATRAPGCPACGKAVSAAAMEKYGHYELFGCAECGLQFWEPCQMPDAQWYERMYGGRDAKELPLEPGHRFFLSDSNAPPRGTLLDVGCGTGNFLAAAQAAGFDVTGTELDGKAARFAKEELRLPRVLPLSITEFAAKHSGEQFDVVTFFEVLEHQADPRTFLAAANELVKRGGFIALSVPNRDRWLKGPDVFDYPPNHFLRWNVTSLKKALITAGFEVMNMKEEKASLAHTVMNLNMAMRTGMIKAASGEAETSFRDVMQMESTQAIAAMNAKISARRQVLEMLARVKRLACYPVALAIMPYVRWKKYKGSYLYCLAKKSS